MTYSSRTRVLQRLPLQRSRRTYVLYTKVVSQGELDFGKLVSIEEVDGVAYDVADIDRPDLVDQHPRHSTPDFQLGAVDRGSSRARGGDHSHDRERRVRW